MAGERDRVWTSRLIRFAVVAAIGFGFFVLVIGISIRRLSQPRNLDSSVASKNVASESIDAEFHAIAEGAPDKSLAPSPLDPILDLAQAALENMNKTVFDYTARLEKQERINGELGDAQFIELKVISRTPRDGSTEAYPLHAYFRYVEPSSSPGREVIWVEGKNDGKLIAHESGFMNVMRVNLAPTSFLAMKGNKYPANQVGLENLLRKLIEKGVRDRSVDGCQVSLEKGVAWEDRTVDKLTVVHPKKIGDVDFHRAEILMDPNLQLPVSYMSYLWPEKENEPAPLEERYVYHDLKINVGLTESDFDPDNPAYDFP